MSLVFSLVLTLGPAAYAAPPRIIRSVDIWGQPSSVAETAGRPLGQTLALFRSTRHAAPLPAPAPPMLPLSVVAAHLRGDPGVPMLEQTRLVSTPAGALYLVPTAHGWLCWQGTGFATCHRGLLSQRVTYDYYSTSTGLAVVGIAADDVATVTLHWGSHSRAARLRDNVFYVARPLTLPPASPLSPPAGTSLPPPGKLVISYRDRSHPAATVVLR